MKLKLAGLAMTLGGMLFFIRMAPVVRAVPDNMDFPPGSDADLVRLAELAGIGWQISHALGLLAVGLFVFGYWAHRNYIKQSDSQPVSTWASWVATIAFGAFAIALVIDGFAVPAMATSDLAGEVHRLALRFFTPAIFLMFIAIGLLSSRLVHRFVHSRLLGFVGMLIAIAGPTAYLFGVTGPNWDNLRIGGSLMMLAFLWHLLVGLSALFGKRAPNKFQSAKE